MGSAATLRLRPQIATLVVQGLIIPEAKVHEGLLIKSTSVVWTEIARLLGDDWSLAWQLSPTQWEEMVAGAYEKAGYKVILTPPSGDHGRDVIAARSGIGSVKILGSVKRYAPIISSMPRPADPCLASWTGRLEVDHHHNPGLRAEDPH